MRHIMVLNPKGGCGKSTLATNLASYYAKKGDEWVHWDYCRVCGFEPGDHAGKDLCPGCAEDAEDEKEDK